MNSLIQVTSLKELGYNILKNDYPNDNLNAIKHILNKYDFQSVEQNGNTFIRYKFRTSGYDKPQYISIKNVLKEENINDATSYSFIDEYRSSRYFKYINESFRFPAYSNTVTEFEKIKNEVDYIKYYKISLLLSLCSPEYLKDFLKDHVFPLFFADNKEGQILVLENNDYIEKPFSFIRNGFLLEHFPVSEVKESVEHGGNQVLQRWQNVNPLNLIKLFIHLFEILFYPIISSVKSGSYGLNFIFVFSKEILYKPNNFPIDWIQWIQSPANFANEDLDFFKFLKNKDNELGQKLEHRKYLHKWNPTIIQKVDLFRWYINKINDLLLEITDPCNFISTSTQWDGKK